MRAARRPALSPPLSFSLCTNGHTRPQQAHVPLVGFMPKTSNQKGNAEPPDRKIPFTVPGYTGSAAAEANQPALTRKSNNCPARTPTQPNDRSCERP